MSGTDFWQTRMGHIFFESTMPEIARQLKRVADALEVLTPKKIVDDPARPSFWLPITNAGRRERRALKFWWLEEWDAQPETAGVGTFETALGSAEYSPELDTIRWRDVSRTIAEIIA